MAKRRKKRQSYTSQQRAEILAAASRDKLTAAQVKRKFGVTPVTYYSWRKKAGTSRKRGLTTATRRTTTRGSSIELQVRAEVQTRVRQVLPEIVRHEVNNYLNTLFTSGYGRKRGQKL
jgi:transposase-like protein